MTIRAWQTNPVTLAIPGVSSAYELRPYVIILNGQIDVFLGYSSSWQGETVQPYAIQGFGLDAFGSLLGSGAISMSGAANLQAEPTLHLGSAVSGFGGGYPSSFLTAWTVATTSQASPVTAYYSIGTMPSGSPQPTFTSAVAAFTGLVAPTPPATVPIGNWQTLEANSLGDGNVALAALTTNGANVEQIDVAIISGAGTTSGPFTYTDPNWTAGNTYAWGFARQFSTSTAYAIATETTSGVGQGQTASLHLSQMSTGGAVTSLWTAATAFTSFDTINWQQNALQTYDLFDLSGTTASGYQHELLLLKGTNGTSVTGGTIVENYTGPVTQVARVVGLGSSIGAWLEYWVDGAGLTLQEITASSGVLSVSSSVTIAGANSTADVTVLGDGRADVFWAVATGSPAASGSTSVEESQIFDFRTAGLNGPGTFIASNGVVDIAGTAFDDNITRSGGANFVVNGGGGVDTYSSAYASTQATLREAPASQSVTITLPDTYSDQLIQFSYASFSDRTIWVGKERAHDFSTTGRSNILFRDNSTGDTGYYQLDSTGAFQGWTSLGASSTAYTVAGTGDFNGNGHSDVLFRNNSTGDTGFYQLDVSGALKGWVDIGSSSTTYSIAGTGDFNGDGVTDVLFRNTTTGDLGFYQLNADGSYNSWHDIANAATSYSVVGTGDFTGDGVTDVLFQNAATGDTGYYQLNADGSYNSWHDIGGPGAAYSVVGVGDFNGDGISDVLFRNNSTGDTGFFQMAAGGASLGWQAIGGSSTAYSVVGVGDYNGDGISDVLFRNNTVGGDTGFYKLGAGGTFQGWQTVGSSSTTYSVVA